MTGAVLPCCAWCMVVGWLFPVAPGPSLVAVYALDTPMRWEIASVQGWGRGEGGLVAYVFDRRTGELAPCDARRGLLGLMAAEELRAGTPMWLLEADKAHHAKRT